MRSARFCLPHWMAFWSSRSPGSETTVFAASAFRAAILSLSSACGLARAPASWDRASDRPWSEPAAAIHSVVEPWAGTVTL